MTNVIASTIQSLKKKKAQKEAYKTFMENPKEILPSLVQETLSTFESFIEDTLKRALSTEDGVLPTEETSAEMFAISDMAVNMLYTLTNVKDGAIMEELQLDTDLLRVVDLDMLRANLVVRDSDTLVSIGHFEGLEGGGVLTVGLDGEELARFTNPTPYITLGQEKVEVGDLKVSALDVTKALNTFAKDIINS